MDNLGPGYDRWRLASPEDDCWCEEYDEGWVKWECRCGDWNRSFLIFRYDENEWQTCTGCGVEQRVEVSSIGEQDDWNTLSDDEFIVFPDGFSKPYAYSGSGQPSFRDEIWRTPEQVAMMAMTTV